MEALYFSIIQYFQATPPHVIGVDILFYFGWVPILIVIIWGFVQVWVDIKQAQYWEKLEWDLLAVTIPQDAIQTPKGMENFFNNLSGSKSAITWKEKWLYGKFQAYFSFEIVSNGGQIQFYIRCIKKYRDLVEAALYAQYPEAQIVEVEDYINQIPDDFPHEDYDCFGTELQMSKDYIFPLRRYKDFEHVGESDLRFKDPILPLLEMMGKMRPGEHYWVQLLIMGPDSQDWRKEGVKWMKKQYGAEESKKSGVIADAVGWVPTGIMSQVTGVEIGGGAEEQKQDNFKMWRLTPDERDALDAVKEKSSQIGWLSKVRVVYCAKKQVFRKGTIASMTKGNFLQFDSGMNKLGMTASCTPKDDYFWQEWQMPKKQRILVHKYKNRSFGAGITPYILSSEELATLWHFPPADARTPVLTALGARMAEAPQELGFAPDEEAILPVIEASKPAESSSSTQTYGQVYESSFEPELPQLTKPTADAPKPQKDVPIKTQTSKDIPTDSTMPRFEAGMPAPLPPGLDISDSELEQESAPDDLPV